MGLDDVGGIDLRTLRSWLARLHTQGASRATLSRRSSAARVFTAWAHRRGLIPGDPGDALTAPKGRRSLPGVLRPDEAVALLEQVTMDDTPAGLRDRTLLELLYASGARVSEVCGLDVDDVDLERHTVRVLGKGDKERVVPIGIPAVRAVGDWLTGGRPALRTPPRGPAPLPGLPRGRPAPPPARRAGRAPLR